MTEMRLLIADGTPVPLTSKAFDALVVLIENRDRVVTKDELLRSVWPDVDVEKKTSHSRFPCSARPWVNPRSSRVASLQCQVTATGSRRA